MFCNQVGLFVCLWGFPIQSNSMIALSCFLRVLSSISDYSVIVENAWFMFYKKKSSNSHTWSAIYTYVNMSRSSHYNYKYKTQKTVLYELMIAKCYNYDLQFNYCYWITIFWTLDFGTSKYGRDHFQFLRLKLVSDLSCFNK